MIYKINLMTKENKSRGGKNFYLTADNRSQLYKRIKSQYGVEASSVEILEEIPEADINVNTVKNKTIGKINFETKTESVASSEATEIVNKAYKITLQEKERLLKNYKVIDIDQNKDITMQVNDALKLPHKKVKLYLTKNLNTNKYEYILLLK